MTRYIDADALDRDGWSATRTYPENNCTMVYETKKLTDFPTADVRANVKGKWLEKKVIPVYENGFPLQSCKCSECGRYDTSPYMYYFSEPNFCSYCGALMVKGEQDG